MPRKPTQLRAKETVNVIIEGGFICLKNNSLDGTTTKKIASIAGVSVGSIYEYFKDKDDIYKSMVQVFVDDVIAMLQEVMPDVESLKIGDGIRLLLNRYYHLLEANDGRYISALTLISRFENESYIKQIERALMDMLIRYTMKHPEYLKIPDLITFIYVVINTGVFSTIRFLNNPHDAIGFDSLTDVIVSMVENHVQVSLQRADG